MSNLIREDIRDSLLQDVNSKIELLIKNLEAKINQLVQTKSGNAAPTTGGWKWPGIRGLWRKLIYGNHPQNPDLAHKQHLSVADYVIIEQWSDETFNLITKQLKINLKEDLGVDLAQFLNQFKSELRRTVFKAVNRAFQAGLHTDTPDITPSPVPTPINVKKPAKKKPATKKVVSPIVAPQLTQPMGGPTLSGMSQDEIDQMLSVLGSNEHKIGVELVLAKPIVESLSPEGKQAYYKTLLKNGILAENNKDAKNMSFDEKLNYFKNLLKQKISE